MLDTISTVTAAAFITLSKTYKVYKRKNEIRVELSRIWPRNDEQKSVEEQNKAVYYSKLCATSRYKLDRNIRIAESIFKTSSCLRIKHLFVL